MKEVVKNVSRKFLQKNNTEKDETEREKVEEPSHKQHWVGHKVTRLLKLLYNRAIAGFIPF